MLKPVYLLITFVALVVTSCQSGSTPSPAEKAAPKKSGSDSTSPKNVREAMAKLNPEDLDQAQSQRICPTSDELLGSMGKPVKLTLKGQTVFLCCASCKDAAEKDPEATLQKIASSIAKDSSK